MDLVSYNISAGNNKLLFIEEVNVVDPFFLLSITNPWTGVAKVATIIPEGIDGEWVLNIQSVAEAYEDLAAGEKYFVYRRGECSRPFFFIVYH